MTTLVEILEILRGEKRFDGAKWVSYAADGSPLVDTGGVLWRGVHGALLWRQERAPQSVTASGEWWPPRATYQAPLRKKPRRRREEIQFVLM